MLTSVLKSHRNAKKMVGFRLDKRLFRRLKLSAVKHNISIQEMLTQATANYLAELRQKESTISGPKR